MTMEEKKSIQSNGVVKDELLDKVAGGSLMPPPPAWGDPEPEASGLLEMGPRPD